MKFKNIVLTLLLSCSCAFAADWQIEEREDQGFYSYIIIDTPENYKTSIGNEIYCKFDDFRYTNQLVNPGREKIMEYLDKGKFEIVQSNKKDYFCLDTDFFSVNYGLSKKQLAYVYDLFEKNYAGFPAMKKKGFSKNKFLKIKNKDELKKYLNKYIDDGHFYLRIDDAFFSLPLSVDEGSIKSKDPAYTYFEKVTSNAYYIRFTNCDTNPKNSDYHSKLAPAAYFAIHKDFIILDARSNGGGTDMPQYQLRQTLDKLDYRGTVIVLQDNWSFSGGELWRIFGVDDMWGMGASKYKRILVGTHSGGMQNYGNCEIFENKELKIKAYFGIKDFTETLPDNYLGDCKGYEPDIWATTQTMKETLEGLGVDLTGVEFQ